MATVPPAESLASCLTRLDHRTDFPAITGYDGSHDRKAGSSGNLSHAALDRGPAAGGRGRLNAQAQGRDRAADRAPAQDSRRQQLADAAGPAHQARLRRVREAGRDRGARRHPLPAGRPVSDGHHRLLGQRQSARRLSPDAPSSQQLPERRLLRRRAHRPARRSSSRIRAAQASMIMPKPRQYTQAHRQRRLRAEQGRPAADLPGVAEAHRAGQ